MMLSDKDLKWLALNANLVEPYIEENCEGATINLTLADKVKVYNSDEDIILGENWKITIIPRSISVILISF